VSDDDSAAESVEVIDTWRAGDDDDAEDKEEEQIIIVSTINVDVKMSDGSMKTHTSLCVRVYLNGVYVGYVLVDQGANRTLIRRSAIEKFGLTGVVHLCPVTRYQVSSAMGHKLPITARFVAQMSLGNKEFNNESVIYVVDSLPGVGDLNCDFILGRHTLATSKYRMIDTLRGRLCAPLSKEYIQCHPVEAYTDNSGARCIRSTSKQGDEEQSVDANSGEEVMSIAVTVEEREPNERRPTRRAAAATVKAI
jgi:hypothetical protein